jgi:NADPH-dependent 2,4-dienoyl-CoA reductase/sulfur reductase-like enzyme
VIFKAGQGTAAIQNGNQLKKKKEVGKPLSKHLHLMAVTSSQQPTSEYDIIVVGAGVVGCAAARAFGKEGRKVLLIERDWAEPDRIVGELLQPGGVNALRKLEMEGKFD